MKKKVYAYIHTHWDREWYREFEEFRIRLIEVFEDVLQKLHSGTLDCFYFDGQTAALEDFLEIDCTKKIIHRSLLLFYGQPACRQRIINQKSAIRHKLFTSFWL